MATIVKRLTKGSPLTNLEVDNNFNNLNVEKLERNGSIPMTGVLQTPGLEAINDNGIQFENADGDLVATFGADGSQTAVFEGSVIIGGESSSLDLGSGDLTVKNINVSGSIISTQLADQYKVSANGDVLVGVAQQVTDTSGTYLQLTMNVILKLIGITGSFSVGNVVTGSISGKSATITKVIDDTLYVQLANDSDLFTIGETISYAANTGILNNIIDNSIFVPDQKLKVFGASVIGSASVPITPIASAQKIGTGTGTTYYYIVVQYRFDNGKLSSPHLIEQSIVHKPINEFNGENNIALTLVRTSADYGLAIYRSINVDNNGKLIAVLGPAELGTSLTGIPYVDYGTYANTEWSTKNSTGAFTEASNIVHFPINAPTQSRVGWVTAEVDSVVAGTKNKIALKSSYTINTGGSVSFVHDNTAGIQAAINDNRELGIQRFNLPNGTYYTSKLLAPSNFTISGSGKQTILKQIPWNFQYYKDFVKPNEKGSIFSTFETIGENIFFENLTIDGNSVNNTRYSEVASNYLVNKLGGINIGFNNVRIQNSVGGGIWAYQSQYLRLQNTEIVDGSLTYSGLSSSDSLSPLYAGSSQYISINNNLFENYLNPVDVSIAYIGTVVGNTIRNCGSGLLIFGSSHLLSSPNLIMGPDNEFIPGPDRFDSDYNSINITLEQGVDYFSTFYLYQELGQAAYLSSIDRTGIPGTGVQLSADIKLLTKFNNAEQLRTDYSLNASNQPIVDFITPNTSITTDKTRSNGYFQFKIIASNVNQILTLSELIQEAEADEILVPGEQVMGLAYRILATTQLYTDVDERIGIAASVFSTEGSDKFVTITLSDTSNFTIFAVGDVIKIYGHSSTPNIDGAEGVITEKIISGSKLKIKLPASTNLVGAVNGGATGYVTIKKTIIIAKGRVN